MFEKIIGWKSYITFLALAHVISMFSTAHAQVIDKELPLDPKVRKGVLRNGFTYYIRHNETPVNRVVFNLVVKVGSVVEDENQSGLAHFMEHMSFNGTKHFPKNHLVDYLQKNGLRFGADINAYTGFDETVYQLPLTNNKAIIKKGLLIIRDWAQDATLDNDEITKERGVILEEKRTKMGVGQRMENKYTPMLFNYSRYALRNPIGTDSNLKSFPAVAIRRFYKDWYRPDLQGIIAVGDFDVDEMEKMIKANFISLKNPLNKRQRIKYAIALNGKNGFMALKDPEMSSTVAQIIIKHKAPERKTESEYRLAIVTRLLNMAVAQRFKGMSTNDSAKVLQATGGITQLMGGLDNFSINIVAKPGKLRDGVETVWTEIERLKKFGFKSKELELAKNIYKSSMENGLKEKNKISSESYVQEYVAHFLHGNLAPGIDIEYSLVMKFLADITISDLNSVARAYIRDDNTDIILMAPEDSSLPSERTFKSWLSSVNIADELDVTKEGLTVMKPLLRLQPVSGKIISMATDKTGITKMILSNGIVAILKPTQFRNDEILFSGFSPGGISLYADTDYQSAKNAAAIVSASGVGNYSHKELEDFLQGKQMGVQPFISELSQGISGGSTTANIGAALELMYAYLTEPVIDRSVFKQMINRAKTAVAMRDKNPENVFQDSIVAILGNHHIRRMPLSDQKINKISIERVSQIYKERFSNNAGMTFTFVGSFNIDTIRPLLEKYLGSLPGNRNKGAFKDTGIGLPASKISEVIKRGIGSKAHVALFYTGNFNYGYKERIMLDAIKGILELRLTERLREQESGVYSPAVSLSQEKIPQKEYELAISFECAAENTQRLVKATIDEINKLRKYGPSATDIQKYKVECTRSRELAVKSNQWWLGYLSGQLQDEEPLDDYNIYLKNLASLNNADLKLAVMKYLKAENLSQFILLPE